MEPPALDLDDLALLAELSQSPTLRDAALRLALPRATLSRRLVTLEARLGGPLFHRHGRRLVPTRFGALVLDRASAARRSWDEVQRAARDGQRAADERLVVAASPLFAELFLVPVLDAFVRAHPTVAAEIRLSHDRAELFDEGVDVAIRRGPLPASDSLLSRRLGRTTFVAVGRPEFAGKDPNAVAALPWIRASGRLGPFELLLSGPRPRTVVVQPRIVVDSQRVAVELVRRGVGVARLNEFLVRDDLRSGALVEIVPAARSVEETVALYPRGSRGRPSVRSFVDVLVAGVRGHPLFAAGQRPSPGSPGAGR